MRKNHSDSQSLRKQMAVINTKAIRSIANHLADADRRTVHLFSGIDLEPSSYQEIHFRKFEYQPESSEWHFVTYTGQHYPLDGMSTRVAMEVLIAFETGEFYLESTED